MTIMASHQVGISGLQLIKQTPRTASPSTCDHERDRSQVTQCVQLSMIQQHSTYAPGGPINMGKWEGSQMLRQTEKEKEPIHTAAARFTTLTGEMLSMCELLTIALFVWGSL